MAWAPAVGLVLGAVAAGVLVAGQRLGLPPLVAGALAIGALAVARRGLHLDGLADTVDGLGSGRPATGALAVMRRGDVGPFGVAALVLTLLLQAAAAVAAGPWALAAAVTTGRAALTLACHHRVPAARPDGLGALVAGTVGWPAVVAAVVLAAAVATPLGARGVVASLAGLLAAVLLLRHAVRRLGGMTGDVLGACCETAVTVSLVVSATA